MGEKIDLISIFAGLPIEIVTECIKVYEDTDIFLDANENYQQYKHQLLYDKNRIKFEDFKKFIQHTRGIVYTDFVHGKYYKIANKVKKNFEYDIKLKEYIYISFSIFNSDIIETVLKIVDDNKDKKYLILDLRNNAGGCIKNCFMLCNKLLPKCEIMSLTYKNKNVTYFSDNIYVKFQKIFILLNEYSASSSEILALTLKKNIDNIFLIGNKTTSKVIGQTTYTNDKYKYIFNVSTFKWFVLDENANDLQKYLQNNKIFKTDDDYFKEVYF